MHGSSALALAGEVHELEIVAVTAFTRVVGLEPCPFVFGQFAAVVEEFLPRADSAEDLAPYLLGRLHFARNLVRPFMGHVAVRATGTHA
ncbi:hypothetical protein D9M71_764280 [compost metagenome]